MYVDHVIHSYVHYYIAEVQMFELTQIVIPKIKAEWETLAYCMRYTPEEVHGFREDDSGECCKNLFANWISTGHGPSPKTYQTLLKHIKKIGKLTTASVAVSKELIEAFEGNNLHSDIILTGFWKIDQIVTLGLFHFIGPANNCTDTLATYSQWHYQT